MPTPDDTRLLAEIDDLHDRLFRLANSLAGNARGNAAIYLHLAANECSRAWKCVAAGNRPGDPIPARALDQTFGLFNEEDSHLAAGAEGIPRGDGEE